MKRTPVFLLLALLGCGPALAQGTDPIADMLRGLTVGKPSTYKGLTIFPLSGYRSSRLDGCLTLGEAMRKGSMTVSEKDGGEVNRLMIENSGDALVFLMAGELLTGCKQDRMVGDDCLLPARSGLMPLTAYCVEHGRWTEQGRTFKAMGAAVQPQMRKVAKESRDQHQVWSEVESNYAKMAVPMSATGAYRSVVDDKEVVRKRETYSKHFEDLPSMERDVCGCAVAIGGRIVCVDIMAGPKLFARLWPTLAASYAMDAIGQDAGRTDVSRSQVLDFLGAAARVRYGNGRTDGVGQAYEIRSRRLSGSALVYLGSVVHCDLFPAEDGTDSDPEPGVIPKLQYRREHRRDR